MPHGTRTNRHLAAVQAPRRRRPRRGSRQLGYGAFWLGGSPWVEQARPYVEAATTIPVVTGILNVWQHDPADVARDARQAHRAIPDRFLLGIGIGHPEATSDYTRPLKTMREFFDGLEAGVPKDQRLAAALGPKMLDLAEERWLGTHPYFIDAEHTRFARERVGEGVLVAPEVAVVVEEDPETARELAREYAEALPRADNYTSNLLKFGYTERDIADGGSDRLIDAVIPHGSAEEVAERSAPTSRRARTTSASSRSAMGPSRWRTIAALAEALL